ncbi:hypothetical protein OG777_28320 [Micromonospora peucetia]|uniref:hypothetical protein n=1 Tax=Micromonospora peucetia TaxID=47871 RepID=UPI002250D16B|nr:hypothetical protein [Micromonospora peucetia]MCX4390807.1 hypothetical protein [Micromonospora peucetia]
MTDRFSRAERPVRIGDLVAQRDMLSQPDLVVRRDGGGDGDIKPADAPRPSAINVEGDLKIVQSNGYIAHVRLHQDGQTVWGTASHSGNVRCDNVTGTVVGEQLSMTIAWNNGTRGIYTSDPHLHDGHSTTFGQGIMRGRTHDELHPDQHASWEVHDRVFIRLDHL